MSNFSFSHSLFHPFGEVSAIFIEFEIVVCKLFQFGRILIFFFGFFFLFGKGLSFIHTRQWLCAHSRKKTSGSWEAQTLDLPVRNPTLYQQAMQDPWTVAYIPKGLVRGLRSISMSASAFVRTHELLDRVDSGHAYSVSHSTTYWQSKSITILGSLLYKSKHVVSLVNSNQEIKQEMSDLKLLHPFPNNKF